jgi:integrase
MTAAKLSSKTIVNYTQVMKLVVASAVNENGDQIHPRVWNNDFAGVPIDRYRVLFALLAGTGLRIGEALGLKTSTLDLIVASFTLTAACGVDASSLQKHRAQFAL